MTTLANTHEAFSEVLVKNLTDTKIKIIQNIVINYRPSDAQQQPCASTSEEAWATAETAVNEQLSGSKRCH